MRRAKIKELKRIEQVLESDRLGISGDCKEVLKRDVIDVLSNYFVLKDGVVVKIESTKVGFSIYVSAEGYPFKGFKLVTG